MTETAKKPKFRYKMLLLASTLILLLCAVIYASYQSFDHSLSALIDVQIFSRLQENMRQQIAYFKRSNQELWSGLNLLSMQYFEYPDNEQDYLERFISQMKASEGFIDIYMLDMNGEPLYGSPLPAEAKELEAFLPGARTTQTVSLIQTECFGTEPVFIYSVPLLERSEMKGEIFGVYPSDIVFSALLSEAFSQRCLTGIVTKTGRILMLEDAYGTRNTNQNLMTILENTSIDNDLPSSIIRRFERNYGGRFSGVYQNERYYVAYSGLGQNGWMLVNLVTSNDTGDMEVRIRGIVLRIGLTFMLVIAIAAAFFLYREHSISERRKYENDMLQQVQQSYQLATRLSDGVMFEGDYHFDTFKLNDNFRQIFGFEPNWRHITDFLHPNENVITEDTWKFVAMGKEFMKGTAQSSTEFRVISDAGKVIWMRMDYMTIYDQQHRAKRLIGKISNIDQQKRQITRLEIEAECDSLTKLYNRASMKARTNLFLSEEGAGKRHAFFILDIDNFKNVNDSCGHAAGDTVLIKLSECLRENFRESDFVARLGGDEFAVLMKDVGNDAMLYAKAGELRDSINKLTEVCGLGVTISCSIGISLYPRHGANFDELYKKADVVLYRVKSGGKNRFMISS